jgi:hypothetical protein
MDFQSIINFVLPTAFTVLGWFCRELWTAVQGLKADVAKLREELPTKYVSKSDFNDRWEEVLKAIHRIEDKLDRMTEKQ